MAIRFDKRTLPEIGRLQEIFRGRQEQESELERPNLNRKAASDPRLWLAIFLVLLWCAGAGLVLSRFQGSGRNLAKAVPDGVLTVTVEPVAVHRTQQKLAVSGSISAWDPISIGSEVSGLRIESVEAEEGQTVRQGQTLAVLNSAVIRATLEEAQAQFNASKANLVKARQPNRSQDINALRDALSAAEAGIAQEESDLKRASAQRDQARISAERYRKLADQGAVAVQDAELAEMLVKTTTADLGRTEERIRAARFAYQQIKERLAMALTGGRREDVDVAAANIAQVQATVHRLQAQLEQTVIKAPTDGLVTRRDAHVGDITVSGKPLFSFVRGGRLELRAEVSEKDIAQFQAGQPVEIMSAAYPRHIFHGRVRVICPQVDANTRMGMVRIDIPAQRYLMTGMFVRAEVECGERSCCAVPTVAVGSDRGQPVVFTVDRNRARSHKVELGERAGSLVEVVSGVSPGDQIIVTGAGLLKDDDPVMVAPGNALGAKGPSS